MQSLVPHKRYNTIGHEGKRGDGERRRGGGKQVGAEGRRERGRERSHLQIGSKRRIEELLRK